MMSFQATQDPLLPGLEVVEIVASTTASDLHDPLLVPMKAHRMQPLLFLHHQPHPIHP